ncbi:hypothetical protein JKP88DRAFT_326931 [Tribonema minus]|uniref:SMP-30/Gluconolactonase/LRE-like region domain-containing protein n=1 Tax=Tribonema minus TaxID=303371 RepID=A0A835YSU9_9STRA|nr:hypothetical protein JKP88DRAFT_326931 [Tribonema minus]
MGLPFWEMELPLRQRQRRLQQQMRHPRTQAPRQQQQRSGVKAVCARTPRRVNDVDSARDAAPAARRTRRPLFAGNWKLNPLSPAAATSLAAVVGADYAAAVRDGAAVGGGGDGWSSVEVAVFPPAVFLWGVLQALEGSGVAVGAQDIYFEDKGAFTGAVAASMVASVGCSYALVGHSERRALFGDDDATVAKKLRAALHGRLRPVLCVGETRAQREQYAVRTANLHAAALRGGLRPVLCVGETRAQREGGLTGAVCAVQLGGALAGVSAAEMSAVVIAYEPVWAIGTGLTATPAMAQAFKQQRWCDGVYDADGALSRGGARARQGSETHADIRRWLKERYGAAVADSVRILYGGSVTPDTAADLMTCPDVDGCLVGGASLAADAFGRIASASLDGAATGPQILYATLAAPCKVSVRAHRTDGVSAAPLDGAVAGGPQILHATLAAPCKEEGGSVPQILYATLAALCKHPVPHRRMPHAVAFLVSGTCALALLRRVQRCVGPGVSVAAERPAAQAVFLCPASLIGAARATPAAPREVRQLRTPQRAAPGASRCGTLAACSERRRPGNVLGESPVWSARRNALYWVDIQRVARESHGTTGDLSAVGQELWELPNGAGEARSWPLPEVAGCCALREGGGFVMGFEGGLAEFVPETRALRRLSAFEEGLATRPNDASRRLNAFEEGLATRPNDARAATRLARLHGRRVTAYFKGGARSARRAPATARAITRSSSPYTLLRPDPGMCARWMREGACRRVDRAGNLVVGSYNANHRANGGAIGGLYRLTPPSAGAPAAGAKLEEILDYRFRVSNCIAFSADGATMTFCDSPTRRIYQFDYDPSGRLSNRRLMYAVPPDVPGVPDGAIMDAQGGLWVAMSGAGRVLRLVPKDPASDRSPGAATHEVGVEVRVPVASPTSATIGGARLDTLFITTRGPDGGALYSVKLPEGVRGVAEPEFADASAPAAAAAAPSAPAATSRASGISLSAAAVDNLSAAAVNGAAAAAASMRPRGPWGALLQGGAGRGGAEAAAAAATVAVDRMFGQPVRSADDVVRAMQASSMVHRSVKPLLPLLVLTYFHWSVKALLSDAPGLAGSLSPAAVASLVRMARAAGPDETGSFLVSTMRIPQEGANIMVRDLMEGFEPTA